MNNLVSIIKIKILKAFFLWPGIISFGVYTSLLSIVAIVANFIWGNIPGDTFFSAFPPSHQIIIAFIFSACFIYAQIRPINGGLMTCFVVCGLQVINSLVRGEPIQIAFWLMFLASCIWSVVLKYRIYHYEDKYNDLIRSRIEKMARENKHDYDPL